MSKRKISLNDRMKSYSLWFDKKSGICFKSAIYHIKNDFQKFVISYENEFRGQPDFKIGDSKSCQKAPKIAKNFTVFGLFW